MTSRDFCYWLQGFFEVASPASLTPQQTDLVKRHLALVFKHEIDPSMGPPEHQKILAESSIAAERSTSWAIGTSPSGASAFTTTRR